MKSYMWKRNRTEWLYVIGNYRDVAHARSIYKRGLTLAHVHRGSSSLAHDIACRHAANVRRIANEPPLPGQPLAA